MFVFFYKICSFTEQSSFIFENIVTFSHKKLVLLVQNNRGTDDKMLACTAAK